MSIQLIDKRDPIQFLPKDIIKSCFSDQLVDPKSGIFRVSKLWNKTLNEVGAWNNLPKSYTFIKQNDPLIKSNPRKAYILNELTRSN
ncbi:MAG: hypothetical protein JHC93_08535, partial [Parachlamydiales bacterium]|nr:hypothetical protein [Parachlamydiales bacterium]